MNTLFKKSICLLFAGCLAFSGSLFAQNGYSNYQDLSQRLQQLESDYSGLASLQSLTETIGGKKVWLLTIGSGDVANHPAVAVVGGADGAHITGSELALRFAEQLLARSDTESIRQLLATTTFYVVPRLSPDATEQFFARMKYERSGNAKATDDDRDGATNEDPYEDLNGDGLITMMRVEDETGKWKVFEGDDRVMVEADITKGEKGNYHLYTEGRNNDLDDQFNEDGEGGVNLNKNFTFDYPYFKPGAGEHMLSENENRALLDFLYEQARNVFAIFSFGPANNLSDPVSFNPSGVSKRIITGWYKEDTEVNKQVSDLYNETTGLRNAPKMGGQPGDFFQWAYFHFGRYSFSTPAWWTPEVEIDSTVSTEPGNNDQAKYLAWADKNGVDAHVAWQEVNHPDFPGKKVEVGGIKPFSMTTPPYGEIDSLASRHTDFLIKLAEMKPTVRLVNFRTESAGRNLTRIKADVYNEGILPTASRLGERVQWVRKVKVSLNLSDDLAIVSGDRIRMIESIPGDGSVSMSWLVRGKGDITLEAGSPVTGFSTVEHSIN